MGEILKDTGGTVRVTEGVNDSYRIYRDGTYLVLVNLEDEAELYLTAKLQADITQAVEWGQDAL